ncbi:MAG: MoxR family ATPase [Firmicutes bacterium]|jgi:MoxR-like ATPase|nr:MoxR family ATPase [Bacillota bacterium]
MTSVDFGWVRGKCREIVEAVSRAVVGKDDVLESALMGIVANGHLLLEDVPGVAKTLAAESFARVLDLEFRRIQFVPDLLPGDVTGGFVYSPRRETFEFRPGPIFANLVLADEVNRGTPKTQSALLEAMQERHVTVEGQCFPLTLPFLVIATQNPIEFEGTYPLPEAQVDRFIARLRIGYPSPEAERNMLNRRQERKSDDLDLAPVVTKDELLRIQAAVENVYVSPDVEEYIVRIVWETRNDRRLQLGASPRGSLAVFKLARARAAIRGRDFVTPEDVKAVAVPALAHRLLLRTELWVDRVPNEEILNDILTIVPTPKVAQGGE